MKTKQVTRSRGQKWIAPVLVFALLAVMIFPVAATLVYPTVTLNPISYHTVGDTVTFTATSTQPCWRMAAKYEYNGTTTWLTEVYSNVGQWSFTVNSVGYYTVTVYARSYEPSDPRSANSGSSPMTFYVYPEHEHSYATTYSYDYSHPHRAYYECTNDVGICDAEKLYVNAYYNGNHPYCTATTGSITKIWCKNDGNNTQLQSSSSELVYFCNTYTETVTDDATFPGYQFSYSLVTDANGTAVQSPSRTRSVTITSGSISPQCLYGYVRYQFDEYVALSYLSLSRTELELSEGETHTLTTTAYPSNASNTGYTWQTSNSSVATVSSSGRVTAVGPGTALISAVPSDSSALYDSCLVTVYAYDLDAENYYDYAFAVRYGGDSTATSIINNIMNSIDRLFGNLFGLRVNTSGPYKYQSMTDSCILNQGKQINATTITQICPGGTDHNPKCTGWMEAYNCFLMDSTPGYNHLGSSTRVTALWTGKVLYDEDGQPCNRAFTTGEHVISMQFLPAIEHIENDHYNTLAHELAHEIGAHDHYHESGYDDMGNPISCTNEKCYQCSNYNTSYDCQMTRDCLDGLSSDENVFCEVCRTDIANHLADHH